MLHLAIDASCFVREAYRPRGEARVTARARGAGPRTSSPQKSRTEAPSAARRCARRVSRHSPDWARARRLASRAAVAERNRAEPIRPRSGAAANRATRRATVASSAMRSWKLTRLSTSPNAGSRPPLSARLPWILQRRSKRSKAPSSSQIRNGRTSRPRFSTSRTRAPGNAVSMRLLKLGVGPIERNEQRKGTAPARQQRFDLGPQLGVVEM